MNASAVHTPIKNPENLHNAQTPIRSFVLRLKTVNREFSLKLESNFVTFLRLVGFFPSLFCVSLRQFPSFLAPEETIEEGVKTSETHTPHARRPTCNGQASSYGKCFHPIRKNCVHVRVHLTSNIFLPPPRFICTLLLQKCTFFA